MVTLDNLSVNFEECLTSKNSSSSDTGARRGKLLLFFFSFCLGWNKIFSVIIVFSFTCLGVVIHLWETLLEALLPAIQMREELCVSKYIQFWSVCLAFVGLFYFAMANTWTMIERCPSNTEGVLYAMPSSWAEISCIQMCMKYFKHTLSKIFPSMHICQQLTYVDVFSFTKADVIKFLRYLDDQTKLFWIMFYQEKLMCELRPR